MEFHGERNLWSFMDEERKSIKLPRIGGGNQQQSSSDENIHSASPARPSVAESEPTIPPLPMSPGTPWTLSPVRVWRREERNCFHSCLSVIEGHHGPVRCLAVALETENLVRVKGLVVYSVSLDQTFKVWRVKVFPADKVNSVDETAAAKDPQREIVECETSPVLSPSWVEKKLQGNYFQ